MGSTLNNQTQKSIEIINKNYDAAIKLLNPQKNAVEIMELQRRKAVYAEQSNLLSKMESQGTRGSTGTSGTYTINNSAYLNTKLTEYTNSLKNLGSTPAITDNAYKTLLEGRITQIKAALAKPLI
jgi:hypothetical protein